MLQVLVWYQLVLCCQNWPCTPIADKSEAQISVNYIRRLLEYQEDLRWPWHGRRYTDFVLACGSWIDLGERLSRINRFWPGRK